MNARTGHLQSQLDADSNSDPVDHRNDNGSCTRASDDSATNVFGWQFLSLCFSFELCILNGSCTLESSKLCTYISSHGDSVIDYFADSSDLLHQAIRVVVDERVEFEHMPVKLSWLTTEAHRLQASTKTNQSQITKLVWDPHKKEMVKSELNLVSFRDKLSRASQLIQEDLNHSVEMFRSALKETATEMTKTVRCEPSQTDNKVSWFDHDCRTQKRKTRKALRSFKKSRTVDNKTSYIEERSNYKKIMKDKKKDHKQNRLDTLFAALQDPQAFWQEIKKYKRKPPKSSIDGVTYGSAILELFSMTLQIQMTGTVIFKKPQTQLTNTILMP